jgi:hypothetical protein
MLLPDVDATQVRALARQAFHGCCAEDVSVLPDRFASVSHVQKKRAIVKEARSAFQSTAISARWRRLSLALLARSNTKSVKALATWADFARGLQAREHRASWCAQHTPRFTCHRRLRRACTSSRLRTLVTLCKFVLEHKHLLWTTTVGTALVYNGASIDN